MRTETRPVAPIGPEPRPRTTRRQDLGTALFGLWLVVGGGIDGWAHRTMGQELETFFTPWHAALYSGFLATATWIGLMVLRQRRDGRRGVGMFPVGYGLGLIGAVLFGIGGVADMVWHVTFGIEAGVEALLSPTHLLLFVGAMLVLSTPLRAAWGSSFPGDEPTFREFAPVLISAVLVTLELLFFFQYLSPIIGAVPNEGMYLWIERVLQPAVPGSAAGEMFTIAMIASILVSNVLILAPAIMLARRWILPGGSLIILFLVEGLLLSGLGDFDQLWLAMAIPVGGFAGELIRRGWRPSAARPGAFWAMWAIVPAVTWSAYFMLLHVTAGRIGWSIDIWSGLILFNAMAGFALALLAVPPGSARIVAWRDEHALDGSASNRPD